MTTNEDSTMKKTPRKGPLGRELRMWGYTVNGILIPWTVTQQILLDYSRLRGLLLCNAKYRYQEALIDWARKQSEQTGNPSDILSREMIEVNMTDIHIFTDKYFIEGKNRSRGERFPTDQLAARFDRIYIGHRIKLAGFWLPQEIEIGVMLPEILM